jgi:hypothetical protein
MTKRRLALAAAFIAALGSTAAYSAGLFSTLPIVGSASFCASTVTGTGSLGGITGQGQGSTGSICGQTIPAGPSIVTGTELIPADTLLPNGASPQTVTLTLGSFNAFPWDFVASASTGTWSYIASANRGGVYIDGQGSVTSLALTLPPNAIDGQQFTLASDQTLTALIVVPPTGTTLSVQQPTALTVSTTATYGGYTWRFRAANNIWYRVR